MIPDSPVSRPGLLHVKMRRWMETLSTVVSSRVGIGQGSSTIAWTTRWKGERLAGSARTPSFVWLACQRITRRSVRLMRPSSAILPSYVRQMIFNTTGSRSNFQIGRTWEPNRPLVDNESWQVSSFVARKRYIPHRVRGKAINIVGIVGAYRRSRGEDRGKIRGIIRRNNPCTRDCN